MTLQERIKSYAACSTELLAELKELSALQEQIQKEQFVLINSIDPKDALKPPAP